MELLAVPVIVSYIRLIVAFVLCHEYRVAWSCCYLVYVGNTINVAIITSVSVIVLLLLLENINTSIVIITSVACDNVVTR